jgi:hypothetical protein
LSVALDPLDSMEIRMLDDATAPEALSDPLAFRQRPATPIVAAAAPIELTPFAVARLDGRVPGH